MINTVYYFNYEIQPLEDNRYFGKVKDAEAHIFVHSSNPERAELEARSYIARYSWCAGALLDARQITSVGPDWGKELVEYIHQATVFGIAGYFYANPQEEIPGCPAMLLPPK